MSRYRGMKVDGLISIKSVKIRRSIDLRELGDFGLITDETQDLPTAGATHRADMNGSTSATRGYTDLRGIEGDAVVDTQDMGAITSDTTTVIHNNFIDYKY